MIHFYNNTDMDVVKMMIVKHQEEVEKEIVTIEGVKNTKIQWLLRTEDGMPNFQIRRFTMGKGGIVPLHTHDWEHEIYVLSGNGAILSEGGEVAVEKDYVAYVDGTKLHGFRNTGDENFVFLCMIPVEE